MSERAARLVSLCCTSHLLQDAAQFLHDAVRDVRLGEGGFDFAQRQFHFGHDRLELDELVRNLADALRTLAELFQRLQLQLEVWDEAVERLRDVRKNPARTKKIERISCSRINN